jgi:hypothetical protein
MREPILHVDRTGEYERVRDLSRRMLFLDSAYSWYASVPDYWKTLAERDGILKKA